MHKNIWKLLFPRYREGYISSVSFHKSERIRTSGRCLHAYNFVMFPLGLQSDHLRYMLLACMGTQHVSVRNVQSIDITKVARARLSDFNYEIKGDLRMVR